MTRIRFRSDHRYAAEQKAFKKEKPSWLTQEEWDDTEPAVPGDIWLVRWGGIPYGSRGPRAGYDICCPRCNKVHAWTTASNCASRRHLPNGGFACDHSGKSSCWVWTGSAVFGTLSASPSLYCVESLGGCGWHGFLTNGELIG